MAKKPIIAENTVDFIRENEKDLALRYPGLFLIFQGSEILGKFKKSWEARSFIMKNNLDGVIVWSFDPLPDLVAQRLMTDQGQLKKERARELARLRQKRYYDKNRKKILERKAKKRAENPEKNRKAVKAWYYKDHRETLKKKKAQSMGVCTKKICTV